MLWQHACPGAALSAIVAYCTHEPKVIVTMGRLRLAAYVPRRMRSLEPPGGEVTLRLRWQWMPPKAERERLRQWTGG